MSTSTSATAATASTEVTERCEDDQNDDDEGVLLLDEQEEGDEHHISNTAVEEEEEGGEEQEDDNFNDDDDDNDDDEETPQQEALREFKYRCNVVEKNGRRHVFEWHPLNDKLAILLANALIINNNNHSNNNNNNGKNGNNSTTTHGDSGESSRSSSRSNIISGGAILSGGVESLSICITRDMTVRGAKALANGIAGSRYLECIEFGAPVYSDQDLISASKVMTTLYRQGCQACGSIRFLTLERVVGDCQALGSILPCLPNLAGLTILNVTSLISIPDIQFLSNGLSKSMRIKLLHFGNCNLDDEHLRILSPILGNHPSLETLKLRGNNFGDEGIACFIEHWRPGKSNSNNDNNKSTRLHYLCLENNKRISAIGARQIMRAVTQNPHPLTTAMQRLDLNFNNMIGFEGLQLIGAELPNLHQMVKLNLNGVVADWVDFTDITCDAAVLQETKRMKAARSLLDGMKRNFYLQDLCVNGNHLPCHVVQELELYTEANRNHRYLVLHQTSTTTALPIAFWSLFLSRKWQTSSLIFLFLRELHVLTTSVIRNGETTITLIS